MKGYLSFFTIALSIYILINSYIYWRGFSALSGEGNWVILIKVLFITVVLSFPLSIIFRGTTYCTLCDILTFIGSIWVGAMLYFFLTAVAGDLVLMINHFIQIIPTRLKENPILAGRVGFFGAVILVLVILVSGWVNTMIIRVTDVQVDLPKLPVAENPTTVVMISDVHLGRIIHAGRLETFVTKINAMHPDLILIDGDLVDESVEGLNGMPEILGRLRAPRGVFAVLGNHEFYAGHEKAEAFMKSAGIRVLRDEVVTLPGLVNLVGMDDPTALRFENPKKVSLPELLKKRNPDLPTILMFHPPIRMQEYSTMGIDLMLSGHSHHGQLFPLNFITGMVYLVDYGYKKIGPMQVYVSSGLGTWGPPMRVFTKPEIVRITLVNEEGKKQGQQ